MTLSERYHRDGHVGLPQLFVPEVLLAFYRMMQTDLQAAGRPLQSFTARGPLLRQPAIEVYAFQYAPMLTFLWGLTPRVAEVVGRELLPTYAYFRAYQQGDVCRVHSDRQACEHSLSLTIAYGDDRPWALSVATERTEVPQPQVSEDFGAQPYASVAMQPGDGVLYQGTHHRHGRLEANPNSWSAHLFLHWVEKDGRYRDQAFDRPAQARAAQGR
ncbi:hypothetical protein SFC76_08535 [Sphingomonas sp. CD22]|jgi:hypothetical protein|uniref:hypothetical protein n=1 Tax=Sphingomonas sp. CD22 TaxID=3100214 RepID=UPI002ADFF660|nr:hypothetical protein [Sphingomonas sp. CD22]MEA1084307.1 hypothetical protein [Sphingomonas sp. CD22]